MHRSSRPEVLDLQQRGGASPSATRTRSRSTGSVENPLSSNASETSQYSVTSHPLTNVSPEAAYIASSAAARLVTTDHESFFKTLNDEGIFGPGTPTVEVTDPSLRLVNQFLDFLLYSFLATARSTSLPALRLAVTEVLRARLASEAVTGADQELDSYLGGETEEGLGDPPNFSEAPGWDLEVAWKRARLQCMVYSSLGDLEEDDEAFYSEFGKLEGTVGPDQYEKKSTIPGVISPAVAIWLTSILEFVGEQTLLVAGHATIARYSAQRITAATSQPPNGEAALPYKPAVEELDTEKVALNPSLGRMWRQWRKRVRGVRGSFSAPARDSGLGRTDRQDSITTTKDATEAPGEELAPPSEPQPTQVGSEGRGSEPLQTEMQESVTAKDVLTPIVESTTSWHDEEAVEDDCESDIEGDHLLLPTLRSDNIQRPRPHSLIMLPWTSESPFVLHWKAAIKRPHSLPSLNRGEFADPSTEGNEITEQDDSVDASEDVAEDLEQPFYTPAEEKHMMVPAIAPKVLVEVDETSKPSYLEHGEPATVEEDFNKADSAASTAKAVGAEKLPRAGKTSEVEEAEAVSTVAVANELETTNEPEVTGIPEVASSPEGNDGQVSLGEDHSGQDRPSNIAVTAISDFQSIEVGSSKLRRESSVVLPIQVESLKGLESADQDASLPASEAPTPPPKDEPFGQEREHLVVPGTIPDRGSSRASLPSISEHEHIGGDESDSPGTDQLSNNLGDGSADTTTIASDDESVASSRKDISLDMSSVATGLRKVSHGKHASSSSSRSKYSERKLGQVTVVESSIAHSMAPERKSGIRVFTPPAVPVPVEKSRRSSSFSKAQRPTHTSGSGSSQTSTKLKSLISWPNESGKHSKVHESDTESRSSLHSNRGLSTMDDKERSFEELISSGDTIHYTITPDPIRNMEVQGSPVKKTPTTDLADFFRSTGPDGSTHRAAKPPTPLPKDDIPSSSLAHFFKPSAPPDSPLSPVSLTLSNPQSSHPKAYRLMGNTSVPASPKSSTFRTTSPPPGGITGIPAVLRREAPSSGYHSKNRLLAREASGSTGSDTTSALADFFRNTTPPVDREHAGTHRISRSVAPFRNTMDSEQFDAAVDGEDESDSHPEPSFTTSPAPHDSYQSSFTSSTALIRNNSVRKPQDYGSTTSGITEQPKRKQTRVKDPYAIDIDELDDDEEDLDMLDLVIPKKRGEESLLDFLNSAPPPSESSPSPQPLRISEDSKKKNAEKRPSSSGLMGRFGRSSSRKNSIASNADKIPPMPPVPPPSITKYVPLMVETPRSLEANPPKPPSQASQSSRSNFVPHQRAQSVSSRVPARGQLARGARTERNDTDSLADFLKHTAPPANFRPPSPPPAEESRGGVLKLFSRNKKRNVGVM